MNVKSLKKFFITVAVMSFVFMLAGCGFLGAEPTETVQKMLDAYTSGDAKEFASFFEEGDRMRYLMKAVDGSGAGEMQEVYAKVYELTQKAEITVVGEGDADEYVKVRIKTVDYSENLHTSMVNAMKNDGTNFENAPEWMMTALSLPGEIIEKELDVRVQANGKMYDASFNEEFFDALTGGFYEYIGCTMASCTRGSNKSYLLGSFDRVLYSLDEYHESIKSPQATAAGVNGAITHFVAEYDGYEGIGAGGNYKGNVARLYLIIDYSKASNDSLQKIGMLSMANTTYISMDASIKGMEASGYSCKLNDFGVGVESDEDK